MGEVVSVDRLDESLSHWILSESPDYAFCLRERGEFVSGLYVFRRTLSCGACRVEVAGIGHVFTPEGLRNRGFASELLKGVHIELLNRGFFVSILIAKNDRVYTNNGYVCLNQREVKSKQLLYGKSLIQKFVINSSDRWALIGNAF